MEVKNRRELLVVFAISAAFGFSQAASGSLFTVLLGLLFSISIVYLVVSDAGSPTAFIAASIGLAPALGMGGLEGAVLFLAAEASGGLIGLGVRRDLSTFPIVLLGTVPALVILAVVTVTGGYQARQELYRQQIESTMDQSVERSGEPGQDSPTTGEQQEFIERITGVYLKMIPAFEAISAVVNSFIVYLLAVVSLARFGCRLKAPPPFGVWRLPESFLYLFILGLLTLLIGRDGLRVFGLNLVVGISIGYLVIGLAIIRYYFQQRAVPALIQGLSFLLLFFLPPFGVLFAWALGLLDIRFNFRHL
jgi:uncharacterized protein YybS (DUF2232 family)